MRAKVTQMPMAESNTVSLLVKELEIASDTLVEQQQQTMYWQARVEDAMRETAQAREARDRMARKYHLTMFWLCLLIAMLCVVWLSKMGATV